MREGEMVYAYEIELRVKRGMFASLGLNQCDQT